MGKHFILKKLKLPFKGFGLWVLLLLVNPFKGNAQNILQKIDSLLLSKYPSSEPGGTFLIAHKSQILFQKAYGMADLERDVALTTKSVFEIGSMTKQFTAAAILLLASEGKLSLDDPLTKYIPDYPTNDKVISIHHLLTHTSGIKSFTSMKTINTIAQQELSPSELINFFKNEDADFEPGEAFKYNNSGYVILGQIIEQVSGISYADFILERIFKPLEMKNSYYADASKIIKNRASGYHFKEARGFVNKNQISYSIPYASGSLMSTTADLLKWNTAIHQNQLLPAHITSLAFQNYTLNSGDYIDYGYGWHLKDYDGLKSYEHGGSIFGFKSMGVYLPDIEIYVIGLTNCDCNSPTQITRDIAILVAKEMRKSALEIDQK